MNEKIAALLNEQINKEFYSAYLYLDIANYYDALDLDGYANYYMIQAQEERDHALLFMKYMQNNGLKVTLEAIGKPDKTFSSVLDPLVIAAEHERYVTALINTIYHEAHQAKDYRTMKFLDWFVDEQMEEEDNADTMVSRYNLFGQDPKGLYLLDQEYAARVYTAPSLDAVISDTNISRGGHRPPRSLSKNKFFDRLAEVKEAVKTSKPKASAYMGTVDLRFVQ